MSDPQQHPAGAPHDQAHEAHQAHEPDEPHEGPIKTPQQLIWTVVAAFVVPIVIIMLLVNFVAFGTKPGAGSEGLGAEAVARRLQPVGTVFIRDASAPTVLRTGAQVYAAQCAACHAAGVAGAPRLGDTAAWAPRVATGYEALLNSVLQGKGAMAAQGGGEFSDYELARAVVHAANESGATFDEPAAPAAAEAASAPN